MRTKTDGSTVRVCEECSKKLEKIKQIAQQFKTKLNKILPFEKDVERYFFAVEKAIKEDKLTLEQLKELKTLLVQVWNLDTDNKHDIWHETVYVCPFIDHYLNILDPKIKEKEEQKTKQEKEQENKPNPSQRQPKNQDEPKPNPPIERKQKQPSPPENKPVEPTREDPNRKADNNPTEPNKPAVNQPHPDNERIWGKDFGQLKPQQRESRVEVNNNYKEKREKLKTRSLCPHCSKEFFWETSEENFLPAQQEAKDRLEDHKKSCDLKNDKNKQKQANQASWDEVRKSKIRRSKICQKCHKRAVHDKSIADVEQADKDCQQRLNKHKKECGTKPESEYSVKVFLMANGESSELIENDLIEQDELGEIYQGQSQQPSKTNWPLIGGIGLVGLGIIGGLGYYFWNKRKKSKQ